MIEIPNLQSDQENLSYCFVDFVSPAAAAAGKRALQTMWQRIYPRARIPLRVEWRKNKNTNQLVARNINEQTTDQQLRGLFGEFGPIVELKRVKNNHAYHAYVAFESFVDANLAQDELNNKVIIIYLHLRPLSIIPQNN